MSYLISWRLWPCVDMIGVSCHSLCSVCRLRWAGSVASRRHSNNLLLLDIGRKRHLVKRSGCDARLHLLRVKNKWSKYEIKRQNLSKCVDYDFRLISFLLACLIECISFSTIKPGILLWTRTDFFYPPTGNLFVAQFWWQKTVGMQTLVLFFEYIWLDAHSPLSLYLCFCTVLLNSVKSFGDCHAADIESQVLFNFLIYDHLLPDHAYYF